MKNELSQKIRESGILAVLVIDDVRDTEPLTESLLAGGITGIELTLRTPQSFEAIRIVAKKYPQVLLGVGTVLEPDQIDQCLDAGGQFALAPGTSSNILEYAAKKNFFFVPGIATPSDIETAMRTGCRILKYFPAHTLGGIDYLKSIHAPYAHRNLSYIPLGGVNESNLAGYLAEPFIHAIGGSWIAPRDLIKEKNWETIKKNAATAINIFRKTRNQYQ
jgi:2-dehydro-3-deoxyphosphogluconate aldolase / (4S)-4-hydroxy-2-oxoglutarate aldolase